MVPSHQAAQLILDYRKVDKAQKDIEGYNEFASNNEKLHGKRVYGKVHLQNLTGRITITDPGLQMVQNPFSISVAPNKKIEVRNLFRVYGGTQTLVAAGQGFKSFFTVPFPF